MRYLALADAEGIHEYVFGTHELKLIRGASQLQRNLAEAELPKLAKGRGGKLVFAGGGRVLVDFADGEHASEWARDAEHAFRDQTATGRVATAVVRYDPGQFRQGLKEVEGALELKKGGSWDPAEHPSNWYFAACERCGTEPASETDHDRATCRACMAKADENNRRALAPGGADLPADFGAIAALSRPENYLAVAYIDIDRLGRFLHEHAIDVETYRGWSERIKKGVSASVEATLLEMGRVNGRPGFEILLIGGDDAVIAMAPQLIFDFVKEFFKRLSSVLPVVDQEPKDEELSCSIGILIAHQQYPIRDFVDGAERLLRSAKKRPGNAVDFAVLTESLARDVLAGREETKGLRLTGKPYGCGDFIGIRDRLARLKEEVSPARLREVQRVARLGKAQGKAQGELEYCYLLRRAPDGQHKALLREFGEVPWRQTGDLRWVSEVEDLMECWRLV